MRRGSQARRSSADFDPPEQPGTEIFSHGTVPRKLPCPRKMEARSTRWSEGQTTVSSAPHSNQTCTFGRQKYSRIFTCQCGPPPKLKGREELEAVCLSDMMGRSGVPVVHAAPQAEMLARESLNPAIDRTSKSFGFCGGDAFDSDT
jgi:hypothetical protein